MVDITSHLISRNKTVADALVQMDQLGRHLTLFVIDDAEKLQGTLTDGDIRRGLIKKLSLTDPVEAFMFKGFSFLKKNSYTINEVAKIRDLGVVLLPILDDDLRIIKIVNLSSTKTILPLDVVMIAGGEGQRLRPLTEKIPKPLLSIGNKPIIEHNLDRLIKFGIDDFWICVRYLAEQIVEHFGDGNKKNVTISYIREQIPLGTIGAVRHIETFKHDNVLVTNSDILTDLDYEDFYNDFIKNEADFSIVTVPYRVGVPYAVLETNEGRVLSFREKPTYTYFSNGGIYLMKKQIVEKIPAGNLYNATDLIELLINEGMKVISYPLTSYWLDIGRMEDYEKAKSDIGHLKL
jgi:dTDP-glucose pyrophosphorylase